MLDKAMLVHLHTFFIFIYQKTYFLNKVEDKAEDILRHKYIGLSPNSLITGNLWKYRYACLIRMFIISSEGIIIFQYFKIIVPCAYWYGRWCCCCLTYKSVYYCCVRSLHKTYYITVIVFFTCTKFVYTPKKIKCNIIAKRVSVTIG